MGQGASTENDSVVIRQREAAEAENSRSNHETQIRGALEKVAAQVYDDVRNNLSSIQEQSVQHSEEMAESLKKRLESIHGSGRSTANICGDERGVLVACLKSNNTNSLACDDAVIAYSLCSMKLN